MSTSTLSRIYSTSSQSASLYQKSRQRKQRSRAHSDDSFYSYSDSFVSDVDMNRKKTKKVTNTSKIGASTKGKKENKSNTGKSPKKVIIDTKNIDQITQRLLSARQRKINELRNENDEIRQHLESAKDEFKLMKITQRRQEKALYRFESQEGELPTLLSRHSDEVRALKEQVRKYRSKLDHARKQDHEMSNELFKLKADNKRMKELVEQKDLRERDDLDRKLTNAAVELDQKDKKISELERHIENLIKNHRHELSIELHRHKETRAKLDDIVQRNSLLERDLSAKTKVLDVTNIYSNRGGIRATSPANTLKPSPSDLELVTSPRDKLERTKLYEQKRREKVRRKQKQAEKKNVDIATNESQSFNVEPLSPMYKETKSEYSLNKKPLSPVHRETKWEYERAHELKLSNSRESVSDNDFFEKTVVKSALSSAVTYPPTIEISNPHPKEARRVINDRSPSPRPQTPPRAPTPPKLSTPPRSPTPPPKPSASVRDPAPFADMVITKTTKETLTAEQAEQRRKKDFLLAKLRAIDEAKQDDDDELHNSKSRYSFSKPVDNLHHGLPSHDDVKVPYIERHKRRQLLLNESSSSVRSKSIESHDNEKKKDLMSALFGDGVKETEQKEEVQSSAYDPTTIGYQPSVGTRPTRQAITKPVVNPINDHVHEDEIEEFIL